MQMRNARAISAVRDNAEPASDGSVLGRREQIVEVAARLFQKGGFKSTSLDEVAAEIGITRPALYYYFRSKEDLLAAIYEQAVGMLIDRASAVLNLGLPADLLLRRLIQVHVRTMLQERPIVTVFFLEKEALGEAAARAVKEKEVAFTKMMAATIRKGQKQGIFRPGNAELTVNAILGMLIWVYQWYRPERHTEAAIVETFWQMVEKGVLAAKRP